MDLQRALKLVKANSDHEDEVGYGAALLLLGRGCRP